MTKDAEAAAPASNSTGTRRARWTSRFLTIVILLATVVAILETEPLLVAGRERLFDALEYAFGAVFVFEYSARLLSGFRGGAVLGAKRALRFAVSPGGLLDLAVLITTFTPLVTINAAPLRLLRLTRIMRLGKLSHTSVAMGHLIDAVRSRRYELSVTLMLAVGLLVVSATAMYLIEGTAQPDKFGSIPRAMWWATVSMTTIGYGDVYPVTALGRVVAGIVAVASIGLIAMPTGILAAAFSDSMQRARPQSNTLDPLKAS